MKSCSLKYYLLQKARKHGEFSKLRAEQWVKEFIYHTGEGYQVDSAARRLRELAYDGYLERRLEKAKDHKCKYVIYKYVK